MEGMVSIFQGIVRLYLLASFLITGGFLIFAALLAAGKIDVWQKNEFRRGKRKTDPESRK